MKNIRKGKGYRWSDLSHNVGPDGIDRETYGFTIDDLDRKTFSEAQSMYEKVFILIRETLETNSSSCMDVESERLQCCQDIADILSKKNLIK
jgi:hypothetical protein|tara:strand:+ start:11349 stop:11624 length:276 start_codon:yes stop_codon:yes gene_type:complete